jgi:uncharacterized protein YheU (UPF0270 family)
MPGHACPLYTEVVKVANNVVKGQAVLLASTEDCAIDVKTFL